jgi:hypothetical protein
MRESYRQNLLNLEGQLVVLRLRKKIGELSSGRLREKERRQIKEQLFNQAIPSK